MEVAHERSQRFKDRTLEVLVEGINPKDRSQVGSVCGGSGKRGRDQRHAALESKGRS